MIWFVLKKLAGLIAALMLVAALIFAVLSLAPGADAALPGGYFGWLGHLLAGNFGMSMDGHPLGAQIAPALAVTVPLALLALLFAALLGVAIGLLAALRPGSLLDQGLSALNQLGGATPNFWAGMVLVLVFSSLLHWLPPGGFVPWSENAGSAFVSLLLPALALALPAAASLADDVRRALVASGDAAYIGAAQARGLTRRKALRRHGRRNAALAILPGLAQQAASIVAGTVIVENVFYLPGLGRLILDAIGHRDVGAVAATSMVLSLLIVGTMFVLGLAGGWLDPRTRTSPVQ